MRLLSTISWAVVAIAAVWVAYELGKLRRTRRWLREVEGEVARRRLSDYTARRDRDVAEVPAFLREPFSASTYPPDPSEDITIYVGPLYELENDGNRRSRIRLPLQ